MTEMAPERPPLCLVCSSPLPIENRRGRPRKVCRDEDSPTPGGCARWRNIELNTNRHNERPPGVHRHGHPIPWRTFPDGGFLIE